MTSSILRSSKLHAPAEEIPVSRSRSSHKKYEYCNFFKQVQDSFTTNGNISSPLSKKLSQKDINPVKTDIKNAEPLQEGLKEACEEDFYFDRQDRMRNFYSQKNSQLDPRDERIKLKFKSQYYPILAKKQFQAPIEPFEDELRDYLVDVIEICTSIGYNHLNRETLTECQTKNFVAKNVLDNIKGVFEDYKEMPLELRYQLMKFTNKEAFLIFDHIARKYPLTRSRGVSKRLKSKVPVIDNRQSNEFDLLFRNNIEIKYREDADYSEDIMKIVNKLISFTNEVYNQNMELEDSNYEVFADIMEYIFENSIFQTPQATANQIVHLICSKQNKIEKKVNCVYSSIIQDAQIDDTESTSLDTRKMSRIKDFQKHVVIGQKIPSGVKMFSEEDIAACDFLVNDSSILRLLTKWAEQLRNKIMNAEETIYRRRFKFKGAKGKLINLEPEMKQHLYKAAIEEMQKIEEQLKILKDQNYYLQTIFAEQQQIGKYSKHDTKICSYAAKLNQISSQYIFKYINILIHSLLTIPRVAAQKVSTDRQKTVLESINLITFKIGDMMRCKCSCSEFEFLKILKAVDSLHLICPNILKISRIKNRLETENNDILINFFFGNKAECELQLSVLSLEKKQEKNNSKFSHLIYEIVRAELGPLSELATIMVQYDPLAQYYSKQDSYSPELIKLKKTVQDARNMKYRSQRIGFRKKHKIGNSIQRPFICCTCQNLAIVHNPQFYYRDPDSPILQCNKCLIGSFSYSNKNSRQLKQHVKNQNLHNTPEMMTFFQNHVKLWDSEAFINELKNQTQEMISSSWFPAKGFAIKFNQKKPIKQLFTCIFEPTYSYVLFANKDEKGEKNILFSIKIHEEKEKKLKNIQKQLKKFALFNIHNSIEVQQGSERFFKCNKPDCCGVKVNPGPILTRQQMQDFINNKMIRKSVQNQRDLLYLNYMPNSLQKLESYLMKVKQKNKIWKIRNTVQTIEAYQCKLDNIKVVSLFTKLQDLNIGGNFNLTSLAGIQHCTNLKYLNCSDCDLGNIKELANLKKLETLNLTNNKKLECIQTLAEHPDLQDLFIRNTKVKTLAPLVNCLKLESLDLEGCQHITSIKEIKSPLLNYINIVNCLSIETFDLPQTTLKSLRTVQITKSKQTTNTIFGFIMDVMSSKSLSEKKNSHRDSEVFDDETISKINQVLKIRKTNSLTLLE